MSLDLEEEVSTLDFHEFGPHGEALPERGRPAAPDADLVADDRVVGRQERLRRVLGRQLHLQSHRRRREDRAAARVGGRHRNGARKSCDRRGVTSAERVSKTDSGLTCQLNGGRAHEGFPSPSGQGRKAFAENLNENNLVAPAGFEPASRSRGQAHG